MDGIFGLCVGDALGVPAEFKSREELMADPVVDMRSYGSHRQPAGTWSDDTSLTLCLIDSLAQGLDYNDIMIKFLSWLETGAYSPFGDAFDVGNGTEEAIMRFKHGTPALDCGGTAGSNNGNGSLMRILPMLYYLQSIYGKDLTKHVDAMNILHNVSALTHAHKRSFIGCGIYISVAAMITDSDSLQSGIEQGIGKAYDYYSAHHEFTRQLQYFKRLREEGFGSLNVDEIKSTGYVVDTLEAALWCLLNTKSYKHCVLLAVNLGRDTDTVAAVAGSLAGLYYGYDSIPREWLSAIQKKEYIESLCNQLEQSLIAN